MQRRVFAVRAVALVGTGVGRIAGAGLGSGLAGVAGLAGGLAAWGLSPAAWAQASAAGQPQPNSAVAAAAALEALPRVAAPPPEKGEVVPAQVQRWREEGRAYEFGEGGVPRDAVRAAELYCRAARYGDAEAQFALAWMHTNGRGIERNDATAAHLFTAAAEQDHPQAKNMAARLGVPQGPLPACLLPPEADVVSQAPQQASSAALPAAAGAAPAAAGMQLNPALAARVPPLILNYVKLIAPEFKLEPNLVLALMAAESNFNPGVVSNKNAQGLMQLIPDTARRFGVRNSFDASQNIRGGMAYLRWLLAYFEGDVALTLAGYNAGEGAVDRYLGVPPYAETRNYVLKIMLALGGRRTHPYDPGATNPSSRLPLMRGLWMSRR
jgi:soluble lytic murein transglycosylase-like protein